MHVIFIFFYEFFFPWVFFDIRIEEELGDPRTILFSTSSVGVSVSGEDYRYLISCSTAS